MNVLVYSGPGVSQTSLSHTLSTLRTLLFPNYTVQTISPQSLALHPWTASCALLVIPGGRDLPYMSALEPSNATIQQYVHNGGKFLGICAGAYYASKRLEWEAGTVMEVSGDRPLRFFKGISRGCVYPGFQYESENGARMISIDMAYARGVERFEALYYNGGGEFVDAVSVPGVDVLARYVDGDTGNKAAAVSCQVGRGKAVLWHVHPEYPLTTEPASSAISKTLPGVSREDVERYETRRWDVMKETLAILGLKIPSPSSSRNTYPLPQFLTSSPLKPKLTGSVRMSLEGHMSSACPGLLEDSNDSFHWHSYEQASTLLEQMRLQSYPVDVSLSNLTKHIIVCSDGSLPSKVETPLFSLETYYQEMASLRPVRGSEAEDVSESGRIGELVLYGEVVTSTQTMLDKNPIMLTTLPPGLLSLASHQLSGRGRGSNTWLSPSGCLQFSLLLRLSLSSFPPSKLVFIQYLFGLAVVEACRTNRVLGELGQKVRLKWPNDIYAIKDGADGAKKIGGILVNTSFSRGLVDVVVGCGLNVLNPPPITSLSHLVPTGVMGVDLSMEKTAAAIMTTFESMWSEFLASQGSFDSFMDLYLERWLHSDQLVTLTTVDPPIQVRIAGITSDNGLLRTIPEYGGSRSGRGDPYIDLQPDGNSFDLMAGLIRTKS